MFHVKCDPKKLIYSETYFPLQDLQNCFQEHIRLQGQVRLLEHRVKQQQLKIIQLLEKKEIQYSDKGDENNVIDLGGKRQYSG